MLDGDPCTGWSNAFVKSATALLPAFSGARPSDWVSVTWAAPLTFGTVEVSFTLDATHTLPASVAVSYWDGDRFAAVRNQAVTWATTSDAPTVIAFDQVTGSGIRLDLTSAHPGAVDGAQRITTLTVPGA
jgi:beta-galactosidase